MSEEPLLPPLQIDEEHQSEEEEEEQYLIIEELPPRNDDDDDAMVPTTTTTTKFKSLARAPTTPCWARYMIPIATLATHALFLYGQIEPMWRLHESQDVDVWYNATSFPATTIFKTFGLPQQIEFTRHEESTIQTFTYSFAIQELWEAKGMPDKKMAQFAAILLTLFSGVWPHLKLALLNWTWLTPMRHPKHRTRCLNWLSCLGKWSLADILVVCVMVGVLHIDWHVDPEAIREGVKNNLPFLLHLIQSQYSNEYLCSELLHQDCHSSKFYDVKCKACIVALKENDWTGSFGQTVLKGISTSGDGLITLRVIGMRGIYAFCAAVVLSIFLSLVVDVWDNKANTYDELLSRTASTQEQETEEDEEERIPESSPLLNCDLPTESVAQYSILNDEEVDDGRNQENEVTSPDNDHQDDRPQQQQQTLQMGVQEDGTIPSSSYSSCTLFSCCHGIFSILVLILILFACLQVTFERKVEGAIPTLLHEVLGMEWTKLYSLQSLGETTGAAGGWDTMLQATFCLFIVFGPIVRSILCVIVHVLPQRRSCCCLFPSKSTIVSICNMIGAFCAWEVLIIAIGMISMLMPSITGTILMDDRCHEIDDTGNCFQVSYERLFTFYTVLIGGVALLLVSNSFSYFVA